MNHTPLISVVVPNFNHSQYIEQLIDSVQFQDYKNFEIIIVDDCSTDDSEYVLLNQAKKYSNIKIFFLRENRGVANAIKVGCEHSKGDLLFATGADDYFVAPDYFSGAIDAFRLHPNLAGFFAKTRMIDSESLEEIGEMGHCIKVGTVTEREFVDGFLMGKIFIPGSSAIWQRELINQIGGYPNNLGSHLDYYVNHLLPAFSGVYFKNQIVANYRIFKNKKNFSANISLKQKIRVINEIEAEYKKLSPIYATNQNWKQWKVEAISSFVLQEYLIVPNYFYKFIKTNFNIKFINIMKKIIYYIIKRYK